MAASIGIKIANGEFYPILEEGTSVKKRLILTTVHDGQESVQIDVYKSESKSMSDAEYIGSLVIEHITPKPKGEPSIEMTITSRDSEELIAEAVDLDDKNDLERHQLTVSLKALEQSETYDLPDFELETHEEQPPIGLYERASVIRDREEQKKPFPIIPILIGLGIVILIALLLYLFMFNNTVSKRDQQEITVQPTTGDTVAEPVKSSEPVEALEPRTVVQETNSTDTTEEKKPEVVVEVSPSQPAVQAKPARTRPPAPVSSYKVPLTIPKEGAPYKIRWGDTLWDISEAFYRNPWLYPRIARFNKIRNPDLIISGTTIRIPPKP
ncbi:Peptidoglycan-binding lysin domain protein [Gracilinema caldarium DSM 7334]|uniref:Peptidoglycan-binding lysin domain protein n=2 Tax=Gracilinema caldarium TaxID=215591 RepID=F8EX00_GRAC1|nr:Peptidoglycan-binding lysin domain protein [Gracilinema caldarium DSM 7334]